ncbi:MAG: hypothetical protein CO186_00540 [Zetaproteobacteria bacterium CG_4_9_14_3_um_filter_49_83]|nr:MAG: hypothetical protein AUJ56_04560 [Zetaproteobacteria bacterium CG1_02_49_23]PIQ33635.1 MAG: hypothetical protein COW62_04720 [Zetaproteobacteria bacterium CG17_big_fil_post_rev_8_21_14_2_50_50_13]PIY54541.1 MAG: hypothetical protein COZ00_14170 [Zetaproteobacteria bacterium CG_4_10_14_0_8_um_filter_49_80]PJA36464.1 MAG: hypothetical protein CO186_00540 [Zetaproteobacteria bacterium CG_4_9_14_3_um_filter_49_83]
MFTQLTHAIRHWIRSQEQLYLGALALAIGALAGYGALGIRFGIESVSAFWTGQIAWSQAIGFIPWYIYIIAPTSAGLLVGIINKHLLAGEARVIPGVLEALSEKNGRISPKKTISEFISNTVSVGSGASMGREAPTVALGASLASLCGQLFRLSDKQLRTLVGCGVAAGIAASFNAPIAGVLFSLEVILADYAVATFTPIVLSSVIATVITRAHLGGLPMYDIPEFRLVSSLEIPAYIGMGVCCGLIGALIVRLMPVSRRLFAIHVPDIMFRPMIAGLIIGVYALIVPEVMSIGYGVVENILMENIDSRILGMAIPVTIFLFILIVSKILTSVICSGAGFGGGMIGPSIFIGISVGALYGGIAHSVFPEISETYGAYALVASGALLAATIQAPMSTILMVFELSGNYEIMIPLMAACVVAALVKRIFGKESAITESLEERGIETGWGLERSWMKAVPITRIPWRGIPSVLENASLADLKHTYITSGKGCVQVVNELGDMVGIVTFADLQQWLLDPTLDHIVIAAEVANKHVLTIAENASLLDAIRVLDREIFEQMPVVSKDNPRKVLGILSRNAIFSKYHKLIVQHGEEAAERSS